MADADALLIRKPIVAAVEGGDARTDPIPLDDGGVHVRVLW
jgi:hypothetical protein